MTGKQSLKDFAYFLYDRMLLPLRFNAKYYLKVYPHVVDKVISGRYRSAIEHYRVAGKQQSFCFASPNDKFWRPAKNLLYALYDKILLPLRFDKKYYLRAYPDVADGIAAGRYRSAIEHYRVVGRESLSTPTQVQPPSDIVALSMMFLSPSLSSIGQR